MKLLRMILVGLGILILIALAIAFLLPRKVHVESPAQSESDS